MQTYRILLGVLSIVAFFLLVNRVLLIFSYNDNIAGIEPVFLYYISEVANNRTIYRDFNVTPFLNCQYAPFYFELFGNAIQCLKIESLQEQRGLYIFLRSVNLILNIASSLLLGRLAWRLTGRNRSYFWIVGLLTFLCYTNYHIAVRPDSLKSFFLVISLVSFFSILFQKNSNNFSVVLFIISGLFAMFTKQDAAILLTALFVTGFIYDNAYRWVKIGLAFIVCVALVSALLYLHYGDFIINNAMLVAEFNYKLEYFTSVILSWYKHAIIYILIVIILYLSINIKFKSRIASIFALILVIAFPLTVVSSAKWGAGPNYYLDILQVSVLLLFLSISTLPSGKWNDLALSGFMLLGLMVFSKDLMRGTITLYNVKSEEKFKRNRQEVIDIRNKILRANALGDFYLLTFEKGLCNDLSSSCLFPAYETDHPELLQSTLSFYKGKTDLKMPSYPGLELYKDTALSKFVSDKTVFAVYPKVFGFIKFYDFEESKFERIDSTEFFYLYKMIDDTTIID